MTPIETAAASVALLAVGLTALSLWVSRLRLRYRVSFGDGGHRDLQAAVRAHGNTLEQGLLFGMLALAYAALQAAQAPWLAACAVTFGMARLMYVGGLFGRWLALRQVAHLLTVAMQLVLVGLIGRAL